MHPTLRALLLALAVGTAACAARGATPRPFPGAATSPPADAGISSPPEVSVPPAIVTTALALRGIPYRNGGSDPSGFDCSGFVQWVFARHGLRLPREVRDQFRVGDTVDLSDLKPGDLVFFETVSRGASHVGLAIGGNEFVHAPSSSGAVRVELLTRPYWSRRFVGARRVTTEGPSISPSSVRPSTDSPETGGSGRQPAGD